jgi:hypothetical protein
MPYMMLVCGLEYPVIMSGTHLVRNMVAVDDIGTIPTDKLKENFSVQWNANIYRISDKTWLDPPHFASAYYNETTGELTRYAMTEAGFRELTRLLFDCGLHIKKAEDYSVGISMLSTMEEILKKKIILDEYEKLFPEKEVDPISQDGLDGLNRFMKLLLPYINGGKQPNLESLARQAGIDPAPARDLYHQLNDKYGK